MSRQSREQPDCIPAPGAQKDKGHTIKVKSNMWSSLVRLGPSRGLRGERAEGEALPSGPKLLAHHMDAVMQRKAKQGERAVNLGIPNS